MSNYTETEADFVPSLLCLPMLRSLLSEEGLHFAVVMEPGKPPYHQSFADLGEMAQFISEMDRKPGVTVYHACASYKKQSVEVDGKRQYRTKANVLAAKALWVDIDCGDDKAAEGKGYPTKKDAWDALRKFLKAAALPAPLLVDSGNGLHAYWPLTEAVAPESWKRMALLLKDALAGYR